MKKIPLTKGKYALVDDQDYELVAPYKWCSSHGYAITRIRGGNGEQIRMHRIITDAKESDYVDHRDGDRANNVRANLRVCSQSENLFNMGKRKDNTTGFKGITWDKSRDKFMVQLNAYKKHHFLGRFKKIEDAILAYNVAAKRLQGDFSRLNT